MRSHVVALAVALATAAGCSAERHGAGAAREDRDGPSYADGALAFSRYCALCHGANAEGYAADNAPSLKSPTFLASASNEFLVRGIRDGRPGTAMAAYGKTRGGPLDENTIASIVAYLRADAPPPALMPRTAAFGVPERGEAVYVKNCQPCHGTRAERGKAVQLGNAVLLATASDAFLRYAVVHGRPGTAMPAFHSTLDEGQIEDVVAMLRSWASPPPPARARGQLEPPPLDRIEINPTGGHPAFTLRDNRYVANADVKRALDEKKRLVIIDARATSDWYTSRIPGSISVPYYAFDRLDAMPRDGTWILAYCACPHHASGVVVDELRKRGYQRTAVLDEGILAWTKTGYPVESEPLPEGAPPPPQAPIVTPRLRR
jgi:mono/diheme cytochrome c family protein/rhodanese-related sulfurtransferase